MADPITVYQAAPSTRINGHIASGFLHVWLDTALDAPSTAPAHCPRCRGPITSVTVGRGELPWFRIQPCTCLFEVAADGDC